LAQWKFLYCIDRFDHIKANKLKLINNFEYYYSEFCIENFKGFPSRGYGFDSPSTNFFLQKMKNSWFKKNRVSLVEQRG
jgi:hypothetical protein